jgi:hypothetical protein
MVFWKENNSIVDKNGDNGNSSGGNIGVDPNDIGYEDTSDFIYA